MLKVMYKWRQNWSFHREDRNLADPLSDKTTCMSIDNCFALLSGIYNLQSCKIAPLGSELDNLEESYLHKM